MPYLGIVYSECYYNRNMADNVKGNYDAKFLEAIDFAFKQCHFNFVPTAEQLQAFHSVVTGNDVFVKAATAFGKSVCYITYPPRASWHIGLYRGLHCSLSAAIILVSCFMISTLPLYVPFQLFLAILAFRGPACCNVRSIITILT